MSDYGWHSEGGRMTVNGEKLIIDTTDGQHGEYVFDYKAGAYKRLSESVSGDSDAHTIQREMRCPRRPTN